MSLSSTLLNAEKFLHYIGNILLLSRSTRVLLRWNIFLPPNLCQLCGVTWHTQTNNVCFFFLFVTYSIFISVKFEINAESIFSKGAKERVYFTMDIILYPYIILFAYLLF